LACSERRAVAAVPSVTAPLRPNPYVLFIDEGHELGDAKMTWTQRFLTLALAAALFLPGALATLNQAAQIVA
jgi:hypothetical protein